MKNIKWITVFSLLMVVLVSCASAKNPEKKKQIAYIQTNAQCEDCKERIEGVLNYEKGVSYAIMDLETKIVEVKYNTEKTSIDKIRNAISLIGYNADDVKANAEAQAALPECCQPGGH